MRLTGLAGKVAVVTGAASGIGQAIVHRLAREEVRVAMVDLYEAGLRRLLGELDERTARPYLADLTQAGEVAALAGRVAADLGTVDFLVNVAGGPAPPSRQNQLPTLPDRPQPIEAIDDAGWSRILAANLTTAFLVCRAFVRR
jgi:2,3-dihydro-2,3-dihydroxybenzoate dehydrogenase